MRDSRTRICDFDQHIGTGCRSRILRNAGAVHHDVSGIDPQRAAVRHRIPGIYAKVHQHLVKLRRVGLHRPEVSWKLCRGRHRFRHRLRKHFFGFLDDMAQLNRGSLTLDAFCESQHVPNEIRAALDTAIERIEGSLCCRIGHLLAKQVECHADRREDIVEIVSDSAYESPDAFKALRPQELLLEILLFSDVGSNGKKTVDVVLVVVSRCGGNQQVDGRAIPASALHLKVCEGLSCKGTLVEFIGVPPACIRHKGHATTHHFRLRPSEHFFGRRIPDSNFAFGIHGDDGVRA